MRVKRKKRGIVIEKAGINQVFRMISNQTKGLICLFWADTFLRRQSSARKSESEVGTYLRQLFPIRSGAEFRRKPGWQSVVPRGKVFLKWEIVIL